MDLLEQAASLVVEEQQSANHVAPNISPPCTEKQCEKCSPHSTTTARSNLDESFPNANLDLASSTDSCSSDSDSDSDSDSETDSDDDEEEDKEDETNIGNLSVISEETSINTSTDQSKSPEQGDEDVTAVTEQLEKLKVEKKTDSDTLNF